VKDIGSKNKTTIINYLQQVESVTVKDEYLFERLECSSKTLERYLKFLEFQGILDVDKTHRSYQYRLKDKRYVVDVLSEGDAFDLSLALDSSGNETPQERLRLINRIFNTSEEYIKGHLSIFEDLKDKKIAKIYNTLIDAVKERLYVDIILTFLNRTKKNKMSVNTGFLQIKEHFCPVKNHIAIKKDISNSYIIRKSTQIS